MGKIETIEEVEITKLIPYARNAKIHGSKQLDKLKKSILEFGFLTPCLIDKDFNLIAGHGRVMAAKELNLKKIPCVFIEGLTDEQRKAYILADNKLGELGDWDMDLVSEELEQLYKSGFDLELTGFSFDDIKTEDIDFTELDEKAEEIEQKLPKESKYEPGTIWKLGEHRLMCGDSTNSEDVMKLIDGQLADLVITDPPYNIDYEGKGKKNKNKIKNDNMDDDTFLQFLISAFKNLETSIKLGGDLYMASFNNDGCF